MSSKHLVLLDLAPRTTLQREIHRLVREPVSLPVSNNEEGTATPFQGDEAAFVTLLDQLPLGLWPNNIATGLASSAPPDASAEVLQGPIPSSCHVDAVLKDFSAAPGNVSTAGDAGSSSCSPRFTLISSSDRLTCYHRWASMRSYPQECILSNGQHSDQQQSASDGSTNTVGGDDLSSVLRLIIRWVRKTDPQATSIELVHLDQPSTTSTTTHTVATDQPCPSPRFQIDDLSSKYDEDEEYFESKVLELSKRLALHADGTKTGVERATLGGIFRDLRAQYPQGFPKADLCYATLQFHLSHPLGFTTRSYARVGLMGNPSDMFHGKTLSCTIENFYATVHLSPSPNTVLLANPLLDPTSFSGLAGLMSVSESVGYSGGLRLLQAACKRFYQTLASTVGVETLRSDPRFQKGFTMSYDTNIPRQVGLAGSSAIVSAAMKALCRYFDVTTDIPAEELPSVVLAAEKDELGISAGLQDRVVQCYGGLVAMDFDKEQMSKCGHGHYTQLPIQHFPEGLCLAVAVDPSDSGRAHNNVRQRWEAGDAEVLRAVDRWRELVDESVVALSQGNVKEFGTLMDANFNLRKSLYGESAMGSKNLKMVEIARQYGASAKFPGSGGAILVLPPTPEAHSRIEAAMQRQGFLFLKLKPTAA